MEIKDIRNRIDVIDDQIAKLYIERMQYGKEIAEQKRINNLPITNSARESEIIARIAKEMPDELKLYSKRLFECIFDTSKAYQSEYLSTESPIKKKIVEALKVMKSFPTFATVAVQGVAGAYTQIAASRLFEIPSINYFKDWNGVFSAVEKGLCQYGVLPIENSTAGSVNKVYDLMIEHNFYIVRSIKVRVTHSLLVPRGVKLEDVKEIISHEQALNQCSKFLQARGDKVKITTYANTALAAKYVAESGRKDLACIASQECADVYGLVELESNIQDNNNNYTRFIAISKDLQLFDGSDKISVMASLPHETGSLNKLLNRFSSLGLNLTKLESRPVGNSPFEFVFYFDFEADTRRTDVQNLLAGMELESGHFTFLGGYKEI